MGIIITPESALGLELAKWEQFPSKITDAPGNSYVYREYPRMVYRAALRAGKIRCLDVAPDPFHFDKPAEYDRAILETERFNQQCQHVVRDDSEYIRALEQGWRNTPAEACAALEVKAQGIGDAAAEVAFQAQSMGAKAQAELKAADADTDAHVVDVVGTPRSVRGTDAAKPSRGIARR